MRFKDDPSNGHLRGMANVFEKRAGKWPVEYRRRNRSDQKKSQSQYANPRPHPVPEPRRGDNVTTDPRSQQAFGERYATGKDASIWQTDNLPSNADGSEGPHHRCHGEQHPLRPASTGGRGVLSNDRNSDDLN